MSAKEAADWKVVKEYRWTTLKESAGYKYQRLQQKEVNFSEEARYRETPPRWVDHVKLSWPEAQKYTERVVKVSIPDYYAGL